MMKATILGSGTCVPRLDRSASALLVETGDFKLLFDIGPGTIRRLLEYGLTIFDLTHVFLSHFHPDHSAELVPLIFASKYSDGFQRRSQLKVYGGKGLMALYGHLKDAFGHWIVLPQEQLAFNEIDNRNSQTIDLQSVRIKTRPVKHSPESLAYRVEAPNGLSVVYSGDTEQCDTLIELAHQTDLFVCESAFPDERKGPGHMTPSLAGRIAQKARAKRLVLTHLYPACDGVDIAKQASSAYSSGPVIVAEDLMSFLLK